MSCHKKNNKKGNNLMELIKYKKSEVKAHIRHDLRQLPEGKFYGNEAIDSSQTENNYSLIDRGKTVDEVNEYRKSIERECFHYNRKDLVHAIEICIQCPSDCPLNQHERFFEEAHKYIVSTLPMGEKCVFVSQVHRDELHYTPAGELISKAHLHIMYVPAVPDYKHDGYEYKLCADALTKRKDLKQLHPGLQKHLDACGIQATVVSKNIGDSKERISFSVKQLKEITKQTGVVIDHSITIDEFAHIISRNVEMSKEIEELKLKINERNQITKEDRWRQNNSYEREVSRW